MRIVQMKSTTKRRHHWSQKYKRSINCTRPSGFSQKQYCKYGRKTAKRRSISKKAKN